MPHFREIALDTSKPLELTDDYTPGQLRWALQHLSFSGADKAMGKSRQAFWRLTAA